MWSGKYFYCEDYEFQGIIVLNFFMEIVKIMDNEDKKVVINSELLSKTIHELVKRGVDC